MKIHNIQQGSPEWFAIRVGKITGGQAKSMVGSLWLELCDKIAAEQLTGYADDQFDSFESDDMIRGKELEPIARAEYERLRGVKVEVFGFVQPDDVDWFGFSPDGHIDQVGAIEIKSPRPKKHLTYIRRGKIPAEHEGQIIAAFLCAPELEWVDFISYCPEIESAPIWICRAEREMWQNVIDEYTVAMHKCGKQIEKVKQMVEQINQVTF
jgi:hypothetical protein